MPDSLWDLEKRRAEVLAEISAVGDFRRGSISATGGRCGTSNCQCHKPDDPGHGPNFRLTYKVEGKTVTESFANPAAQRKAEREIANFRTYQELSRTLIETNEQICRVRPVEDTLTAQEKNGGNDPAGSRAGSKRDTPAHLSGAAQDPAGSIWKQSRGPCGRLCIRLGRRHGASCCGAILPAPKSARSLVPAERTPGTERCVHGRC
jgi:hypothetical protein